MSKQIEAVIAEVSAGSLAAQAGVSTGDALLAVDGERPRDYIEYRFLIATDALSLELRRPDKSRLTLHIEKEPDEDLGIRFTSDVFDQVLTCRCRCEFCFVAQLPAGLRQSLYLKDDDYRLSFLHGNFITLSNLGEEDYRRILQFHLSPLWVSVHATDPGVRGKLMGCEALPNIVEQLGRLVDGGIELHTQVVVCPGWNDGAVLEKTVADLAALFPAVQSIGLVPAGVNRLLATKSDLYPVGAHLAKQIVGQVQGWQKEFLAQLGTRLVWTSDEMYLLAGIDFPPAEEYEEFIQRENGIGEARIFLDEIDSPEFAKLIKGRPARETPLRLLLGTGPGASGLVARLAERCNELGLATSVVVAPNQLFGPAVTTASLIPGADWLAALAAEGPADLVILPRQALNSDGKFVDDLSRRELAERLGCPIGFARTPLAAAELIAKYSDNTSAGSPAQEIG